MFKDRQRQRESERDRDNGNGHNAKGSHFNSVVDSTDQETVTTAADEHSLHSKSFSSQHSNPSNAASFAAAPSPRGLLLRTQGARGPEQMPTATATATATAAPSSPSLLPLVSSQPPRMPIRPLGHASSATQLPNGTMGPDNYSAPDGNDFNSTLEAHLSARHNPNHSAYGQVEGGRGPPAPPQMYVERKSLAETMRAPAISGAASPRDANNNNNKERRNDPTSARGPLFETGGGDPDDTAGGDTGGGGGRTTTFEQLLRQQTLLSLQRAALAPAPFSTTASQLSEDGTNSIAYSFEDKTAALLRNVNAVLRKPVVPQAWPPTAAKGVSCASLIVSQSVTHSSQSVGMGTFL